MLNYYEFFAGGGMARAGLGEDWNCLFANDFCEKKASAYRNNWGADHLFVADVNTIGVNDLPAKADLAWASFPCQDLSLAGNKAGLVGRRSGSFWAFWRLIVDLAANGRRPPLVALENVFGTLTSHGGKDFDAIVKALAAQDYQIGAMVVDAARFVPQSRPRLFIIAADASAALPIGTTRETPNVEWHPEAIVRAYRKLPGALQRQWKWWDMPTPGPRQSSLEDIVEENPAGVEWNTPQRTNELLEMMAPIHRRKVLAAQADKRQRVGAVYRRTRNGVQRAEVRFDGLAGCLRTPGGGSSRQTILVVNPSSIRSRLLSPREAARLMGLPESYLLPERYNDAYMLVGDGLAVPVVAHISQHLLVPILNHGGQQNRRTRQSLQRHRRAG
jgi:DNA (cytosine-5)-methyltransferase 1